VWGVEEQLHTYFITALGGDRWSASRVGRSNPAERENTLTKVAHFQIPTATLSVASAVPTSQVPRATVIATGTSLGRSYQASWKLVNWCKSLNLNRHTQKAW
jgi:hypothetical protein